MSCIQDAEYRTPKACQTRLQLIARVVEQWSPHPITLSVDRHGDRLVVHMHAASPAPADLVAIEDRVGALDGTITVCEPEPGRSRLTAELACA